MPRARIPVERAIRLYQKLGRWRLVAKELTRRSGQPFKENSIRAAVFDARRQRADYDRIRYQVNAEKVRARQNERVRRATAARRAAGLVVKWPHRIKCTTVKNMVGKVARTLGVSQAEARRQMGLPPKRCWRRLQREVAHANAA